MIHRTDLPLTILISDLHCGSVWGLHDPAFRTEKGEPERVKFDGDWEDLASRVVKPAEKSPPRDPPKRTKAKPKKKPAD